MLVKIPELAIGKFKIYTMSVLGGNRRILGEGRVLYSGMYLGWRVLPRILKKLGQGGIAAYCILSQDVLGMACVTRDS